MDSVIEIEGVQNDLFVFQDRLVIATKGALGTLKNKGTAYEAVGSLLKSGEKTILFRDIKGINYSKPTLLGHGYLMFNTGASIGLGKIGSALSGNSFSFDKKTIDAVLEAKEYIENNIS